jgi:hypothetical protein
MILRPVGAAAMTGRRTIRTMAKMTGSKLKAALADLANQDR